jgi:hypothetical protein
MFAFIVESNEVTCARRRTRFSWRKSGERRKCGASTAHAARAVPASVPDRSGVIARQHGGPTEIRKLALAYLSLLGHLSAECGQPARHAGVATAAPQSVWQAEKRTYAADSTKLSNGSAQTSCSWKKEAQGEIIPWAQAMALEEFSRLVGY